MCNLSWTPHYSLEKDKSLNHSCVSQKIGCLEYLTKKKVETSIVSYLVSMGTAQFHCKQHYRNSERPPIVLQFVVKVAAVGGHPKVIFNRVVI